MRTPEFQKMKTPFYLYDLDLLDATLSEASFQAWIPYTLRYQGQL
jgi:hypothetical protein